MLQMSNQFYGGKILPDAGSYQKLDEKIPLHVVTGSDKARAFYDKKMQRQTGAKSVVVKDKTEVDKLREDFDFAMTQIEEDEKFLKELEEDGSKQAKAQMRIVMAQTAEHLRRAKDLDTRIKAAME